MPRRDTGASLLVMRIRTTRFVLDEVFQKIYHKFKLLIFQLNIGDFQESDGAIPAGDPLGRYNGEKFSAKNQHDVSRSPCIQKSKDHPGW